MRFIQFFIGLKSFIPVYKEFFIKYKYYLVVLIILGSLQGFLEGVGIGMLIPLFSFIVRKGDLGNDLISRIVKDLFAYFGLVPDLWPLLTVFIFIFISSALISFFFGYFNNRVSMDFEKNIKSRVYRQILSSSWPFLLKQKIGHLEHILMIAVSSQVKMARKIFDVIHSLTGFIMYFLVAISISGSVTLITVAFGAALLIFLLPHIRRLRNQMEYQAHISKTIAHDINENVTGLKTIKAMGIEEEASQKGLKLFDQLMKVRNKQFVLTETVSVLWQPLTFIFVSLLFVISYTYNRNHFDLAAFVAVVYLAQRIFTHINKLHGVIYSTVIAYPYAKLVLDLSESSLANYEDLGGRRGFDFSDLLEFRDVHFGYSEDRPILSGLSFSVKKGEMVGIIGTSGGGKTTICDLILRLFKPERGNIFMDGINVEEVRLTDWRRRVGYVSQDIFLKNDTIENNIKFFDDSLTDEEMIEAAKMAYIYDFIQSLPRGFKTKIGEHGVLLSAGQRQRVILARIFVRKPVLLLLDEATSALDNESESFVRQAVEKLKGQITIITVAHRLSTVMRADRLLVLDQGRIVEEGEPTSLLEDKDSYFYRMYNLAENPQNLV